jgi:hypothetical protein
VIPATAKWIKTRLHAASRSPTNSDNREIPVRRSLSPYNHSVAIASSRKSKNYMVGSKKSKEKAEKRGRGRPVLIQRSIVLGQADHYRIVLHQFWPKLGTRLLAARSAKEIVAAVREDAVGISGGMVQFADLILKILRDPKFPRARPKSQIHFLADSLGGQGFVTPRRSREICAEERSKVKHVILRREYYIECSCGYEGPARDGACRNCGSRELS